ncbi:MAG TPA: hypothetical protein VH079_17040 [Terriglobales bacterium]|jgi:hypothetical protein|nr:hypothetical protein [Terriglobales bacterium]
MVFNMSFDARNNLLRVTLEGEVTDAILADSYATAAKYVAANPPCRGVWDFSKVTQFEVSTDTIRELARTSPIIVSGHMRVVVAPQDHLYGMARMFQILGQETRSDLHVVRTMDEAYCLLQVELPEFVPIERAGRLTKAEPD